MLRIPNSHRLAADRPLRILHVVGEMNRGGIETWLMHVLREIDHDKFVMDFAVEDANEGAYESEILDRGSKIHRLGSHLKVGYGRRLRQVINHHGAYDVVHGHLNHFNGYVMRVARRAGVRTRISHSHTDTTAKERNSSLRRRMGVGLLKRWIAKHSTHGLAASAPAAISMFGDDWQQQGLCCVLHCGLDLKPFLIEHDRATVRRELGIPQDAWVVGHVGRMIDVKNHSLIVENFAKSLIRIENAYLLLVGEGPLRDHIENQSRELGVLDRVVFTGSRDDVPRLLCGAMDVFMFPSKFEGLGMALVEAQSAGLPCLVSDVVPCEAEIVPELITRLSVNEPWVSALINTRSYVRRRRECLAQVLGSDFSIQHGVARLQRLYETSRTANPSDRDTFIKAVR